MGDDSKRNFRKNVRNEAEFFIDIYADDHTTFIGPGKIIDISLEGMSMESEADIPMNNEIVINFLLDKEYFSVPAEIVRADKRVTVNSYGVKFTDLSRYLKDKLQQYMLQQYVQQLVAPGAKKSEERRKKMRNKFNIPVGFYAASDNVFKGTGEGLDLSSKGVAIKTDIFIFVQTKVTVHFILKKDSFVFPGEVVGMNTEKEERIYRIKFEDAPLDKVEYIQEHISEISSIAVMY
ncbi:MAG: PilZ domain-containing protein [Elusimicrobia bacterium]|nr:PilZ domain-containing protein [Elusimicrobiota bacterium]